MNSLIVENGQLSDRALATAQWAKPQDVSRLAYNAGALWLGRAADSVESSVGFKDDRHALIIAGSRSGKGTSAIIPNLCLWPGSLVVIDPKGENATIVARRRAGGSEYCDGLDQRTFVLDPFKAAQVADELRATFNPLDALDPHSEEAVDDAGRIADAIVVITGKESDPFWNEQARTLIKGLILYVLTSDDFEGRRNLVTVRKLITSGDIEAVRLLQEANDEDIPSAFELLFAGMAGNDAFHGIISGLGETLAQFAKGEGKTLNSILSQASSHTEFIDSLPMQRLLARTSPGFALSHLKTDPMGISLFLSLPQRFMNTHFRWLRMMTSLIITEMEKTTGAPQTGHPVLLVLDEFAGLKKMDIIENAAAQIAGFGVKLCFVVQTLTQLKSVYQDNWEIFIGNAGTKLCFGIDDKFTRDYLSKYLGETEVVRKTRSASETHGTSRSLTRGTSESETSGSSHSWGTSRGTTSGSSWTNGGSSGSSVNSDIGLFWNTAKSTSSSGGSNWSSGGSSSTSSGTNESWSTNSSRTSGRNESETTGENESQTIGTSEAVHKRALLTPDEIGLLFSRMDDKLNPAYPGLALVLSTGERPAIVRRTNYFEDDQFVRMFDPHPDHAFSPRKALPGATQSHEIKNDVSPDKLARDIIAYYGQEAFDLAIKTYDRIKYEDPAAPLGQRNPVQFAKMLLDEVERAMKSALRFQPEYKNMGITDIRNIEAITTFKGRIDLHEAITLGDERGIKLQKLFRKRKDGIGIIDEILFYWILDNRLFIRAIILFPILFGLAGLALKKILKTEFGFSEAAAISIASVPAGFVALTTAEFIFHKTGYPPGKANLLAGITVYIVMIAIYLL